MNKDLLLFPQLGLFGLAIICVYHDMGLVGMLLIAMVIVIQYIKKEK